MDEAVVIGNGESRAEIVLPTLGVYSTFGCNALYRDYMPSRLIAVDRGMVDEIVNAGKAVVTRQEYKKFYRNSELVSYLPDIPYQGVNRHDDPRHWGAGPYALLMASLSPAHRIYLIGFDLFPTHGRINNIYKGTPNYDSEDSRPVNPDYWIQQLYKVQAIFDTTYYVYILPEDWPRPKTIESQPNVSYMGVKSFKNMAESKFLSII